MLFVNVNAAPPTGAARHVNDDNSVQMNPAREANGH